MSHIRRFAGALALLIALTPAPSAGETNPRFYEEATEAFIQEVDRAYPFFDLKGIRHDWEALKPELRRRAAACDTKTDFYAIVLDGIACLRDSHMSLHDIAGEYPEREKQYYPGLAFLAGVNNQVVVMSGPADQPLLRPGAVVLRIDGEPAREFMERRSREAWERGGFGFSSPQRARLFEWRNALRGPKDATHTVTARDFDKEVEVVLTNQHEAYGWPHTYAMPEGLQRHGDCLYTRLPSDIGYIYLRRIRGDVGGGMDAALKSFGRIKGLIVDLRGNGGGGYRGELFKRFTPEAEAERNLPRFWGNMVVLIDAGTISAGETFARDLFHVAGAHIMGETTAGSSTAKREWALPHDLGQIRFSYRSRWGIDGEPIEYNGIAPHEVVLVDPADLRRGVNTGIRRAEEYLLERWDSGPSPLESELSIPHSEFPLTDSSTLPPATP